MLLLLLRIALIHKVLLYVLLVLVDALVLRVPTVLPRVLHVVLVLVPIVATIIVHLR